MVLLRFVSFFLHECKIKCEKNKWMLVVSWKKKNLINSWVVCFFVYQGNINSKVILNYWQFEMEKSFNCFFLFSNENKKLRCLKSQQEKMFISHLRTWLEMKTNDVFYFYTNIHTNAHAFKPGKHVGVKFNVYEFLNENIEDLVLISL